MLAWFYSSTILLSTQLGACYRIRKQRLFAEEAKHEEMEASAPLSVADCPYAQP